MQEVRAVSCIAKIKKYTNAFFEAEVYNPTLIREDTGEEYKNPAGDTHTLAAQSLYPELNKFAEETPWLLVKEAKKDMGGWNRRQRGKILSFTLIYGGSASRISTALQVEVEVAQRMLDNYFIMFPELKEYINIVSTKAKYQGWIECPVTNRRYWVRENNAKGLGDDNTVARKACNTTIQGLSSIMTKKGAWYVMEKFDALNAKYSADIPYGKEAVIVGIIHDRILSC